MRHAAAIVALLIGLVLVAVPSARAQEQAFFGIWDVNTYLTTASGPVNPDYRPGELRTDVWRIEGAGRQSYLTTRDGTMPGLISGSQARFQAEVPLGQIIVMRIVIDAWLNSTWSMRGTITVEYWDRRFGYKVGLDAWTFEGLRR